ncbi:putative dehydrogenase [Opitutaceae bacterium TAV1]|nr:putative dehydrogenase [Opitutaceae bacterium TAV1]
MKNQSVSDKTVRFGLIGSGGIAGVHVEALARIPAARLAAIHSPEVKRARELAEPAGARVCATLDELLAAETGVEAVLIASPSGLHAEGALPSLRAGKHVLCEKPLEITTERVAGMIAEARRSGVLLAGLLPLRCGASARQIRRAIEAGRFGKLTFLSARIKWWREPAYYAGSPWRGTRALDGGGALMNQGIHAVDLLQWLGGPVREVWAFSDRLVHAGIEVEDTLAAGLRFENGALGTIEAATTCYPGLDLSLEISGERGTAILVNDRIECWRFADERPEDEGIRSGEAGGEIRGGSADPKAISCEGHRQQIAAFCEAIRGSSREGVIDGREAGAAVAIIEAAYRSTASGRAERVTFFA